jgi:hypothetical protein
MIQLNNLTEVSTEMTELSDRQISNIEGGKQVSGSIIADYDASTKASGGYVNGYEKAVREILTKNGIGSYSQAATNAYERGKANDGGVQTGEAYWIRNLSTNALQG